MEAERIVEEESRIYLEFALPSSPTDYAPLPVRPGSDWKDNVEVIGSYLEELSLLPFVLTNYEHFHHKVPRAWRFVFENTTSPSLKDLE